MLSFRFLCRFSCAFLISAGVGLGGSPAVYAQQEGDGGGRLNQLEERSPVQRQIEVLRKQGQPAAARRLERRLNRQRATAPGLGAKDLSNYTQFGRTQALTPNDNPNPELNFDIVGSPVRAGDVNGDGINDYLYNTMYGTPPRDERTSELSDRTGKTALFFGGDTPPETPDQLLYSALSPVGDLNGDGRSDAVQLDGSTLRFFEGTTGGYTSSGVTVAADSLQPIILGFTDFDGDGYGDVLLVDNGESSFQVVYGGATFGDATLRTYSAASQAETFRYNAADLDGTGSGAVVRLAERGVDDRVQVFEIDADTRSLTRAQDFVSEEIQVFNSTIKLADINGNGKRNLFVTRSNQPAYVFARSSGEFNQTPVTFQKDDATPIGDLDGDGNHDFYVFDESTGTRYVAYGPDNLSDGLSFDTEISYNEKVLGAPSFLSAYGGLGDVTGDGTDDAVLGYFAYTEKPFQIGRRFVRGQADRTVDLTTVSYPRRHIYDRVGATANVGDVNDDGTDDFAAVFIDRGKVGIYFGGQTIGDTPDRFLTIDGGTFPVDVAGGDFNGDGVSDVVVPFDGGGVSGTSELAVFYGGGTFDGTVDQTLSFADAAPSGFTDDDGFQRVADAGDVNDDGVSDLLVSAPYNTDSNGDYLNQAYLYYGGSSLSSTPSVTINYRDSLGTGFLGRMQVTGIGDFNDDGVDDFAIGLNQASTPTNTDGKVHVFYGNSSSVFDGADLTLVPEAREQEGYYGNGYSIAGGQDVNGDGVPDLVLLSAIVNTAGGSGTAYPVSAYYGNGESVEDDFAQEADRTNARWRVPVDALGPTASTEDVDGDGTVDFNFGALSLTDLNQDGASEIVLGTGNYTNTNAVVFRGGAGGLRDDVKGPYAVYPAPNSDAVYGGRNGLATGDFTDNGRIDAVFAQRLDNNDAANSARLYRHEGPKLDLFGPEQLVVRDEGARSLDIRDHADLDGDGDQDVIVEAYLGSTADDQSRVELRGHDNDGTGSFSDYTVLVEPQGEFFDAVEVADVTGDGNPDLLWGTGEQIVWKKNQGNGTFGEARQINITTGAYRMAVGDVNGDNSPDIVAEQENGLVWYPNETEASDADSDGFGGATSIRTFDKAIEQLRLADLNGDERLDISLLLEGGLGESNELLWFVNQGDESFDGRRIDTRSEGASEALRTTDLDRDGDLDLLTADESIGWYENQGGSFSDRKVIQAASSEGQSWYAEAADLDADGTLDLVSSELGDGRLEYRDGIGTAQFGDAQLISRATVAPFNPTPTDLDGDGDYDLLVPTDFDNSPAWYENTKTTVPTSPQGLTAARADGGVELDWSGSAAGYHVYRARRPFYNPAHAIRVTDDPVSATSFTDAGVAIDRRYYYRVTAVDGGESAPSGQATGIFSRPNRLAVNVERTFDDASGPSDYRLVALPGQVDRSLADVVAGEAGVDWQAYWDDGSSNSFLIEHDGSDTFDFRAGRGFWLTATQSWAVTDTVSAVPLSEDGTVSLPLHDGWNIISNPLGIDVPWSAVSQANGGGLEPAWYFNGSFGQADSIWTAATGQAYYFLNDQGLDSLAVPYGSSGQASIASAKDEPSNRSVFRLQATAAPRDTLRSVVRLGTAMEARRSLDGHDTVAPPGRFSALSVRARPPGDSLLGRHQYLATDLRAADKPNHTYDLRLRAEPGTDVTLTTRGIESVEAQSVVLLDPATGARHNLHQAEAVTVTLEDSSRRLRVAYGQKEFVEQKTEAVVPDEVSLTPAPNPVRTQATLRYTVPEAAKVRLDIYDVLGRKVATLARGRKEAGHHRVRWAVKDLTSGVYFGRLRVGKQTVTRKLTVVR